MCQTEPLDQISDKRLFEIRHILPVLNTKAAPIDVMSGERFPGAIKAGIPGIDATYICTTNWSDTEGKDLTVDMSTLSLDTDSKYVFCSFYSGIYVMDVGAHDIVNMGSINPHASELVKVQKFEEKPIIVASDYNYTMGGECLKLDIVDDELIVEVPNLLPVEINYKVLLPKGYAYKGSTIADICFHSGEDDIKTHACKLRLIKDKKEEQG